MSQIPFVLKVGQVQSYGEGQTFGWVRSAQSPDGTIYFCKGMKSVDGGRSVVANDDERWARILRPTSGTVEIEGRVSALLDLGAGFHPEFTGRENVRLCAALHGLSNRDTRARLPEIEAFAEIGEFIDRPVRTYSSGMLVRLAFAAAISMEPEILLVDEALAVGDYYFRQRCMRRVHELRAQGVTILFVSHSMADVQALGTRALWLDRGRVAGQGDPATVVRNYLARMKLKDREASANRAALGNLLQPSPKGCRMWTAASAREEPK